jgi:signal peptidase I
MKPVIRQPAPYFLKELRDWAKSIIIALIIVLIIHTLVFNFSSVKGHSMEPTLRTGQWLFVNKAIYVISRPHRGDIVILKDPDPDRGRNQYLVKRIIGEPGDRIEFTSRKLYVNGEEVTESYIHPVKASGDYGPFVIPEEHYFVMGDNRSQSRDSRSFGAVPAGMIEGRVEWIFWPIEQIKALVGG